MKNYIVNVVNGKHDTFPVEDENAITISRKQYTELLCTLSEYKIIDDILKLQPFSCGTCKSFSVPSPLLYSVLKKVEQHNEIAEIIACSIRVGADQEYFYSELQDMPEEIRENVFRVCDDWVEKDFHEQHDTLKSGCFVFEGGELYQFPFEECAFVFDRTCSCNNILSS